MRREGKNKSMGELKALCHNAVGWAKGSGLRIFPTGEIFKVSGAVLLFFIMLFLSTQSFAFERCKQYIPEIRKWNSHYMGLDYPYHFAVGQAQQESNCRSDVTAFDAGQGIFQFMPATGRYVEGYLGKLDMYNPSHAIKANAWYMRQLHKANPDGRLWITYMFYNSGMGTVKKEYQRVEQWCYEQMKKVCKRKVLVLKGGKLLDLCNVGYDYPIKIYNYGNKYKTFNGGDWGYW